MQEQPRTYAQHPCEILTYNPKCIAVDSTVILADPNLRERRFTVTRSGNGRVYVEQGDLEMIVRRRDILGSVEPSVIGLRVAENS
jgi:predicted dinucleotide-utilizing enzyme